MNILLFNKHKTLIMTDITNNPDWKEHKNQDPKQNEGRGTKEEASDERPQNRLKDGTNDLQNSDQESDLGEPSERSSQENKTSQAGS